MMCQTSITSIQSKNARISADAIWMYWETARSLRRSMRSAAAPPSSDSSKIGAPARNAVSPSKNAESVMV